MDFIVDTAGDEELQIKTELLGEGEKPYFIEKEDRVHAILELFDKKKCELDEQETAEEELQNKLRNLKMDNSFDNFFSEMRWNSMLYRRSKNLIRFHFDQLDTETGKLKSKLGAVDVDKEMQMSLLKPGIEKEHSLPDYDVNKRKLKALRKKEREKTKGPGWYNLPAPEVTEEMQNDLQVLKMRSAMDPKHFYKKNDMELLPKYFQVGRIMDSALDHVNERVPRKMRKRTMVDELLADAQFHKYNKKKYKEIIDEKRRSQYRTHMRDRRQRSKAELKRSKAKSKRAQS